MYAPFYIFAIGLQTFPDLGYIKDMKRGVLLTQRGFGAAPQEKVLHASAIKHIYRNDLKAAFRSLRKGDVLYAATLRGVGSSADMIETSLDLIHSKGAAVIDCETGWRSDGPMGAKLMRQASRAISRSKQGSDEDAEENGRTGGLTAAKNRKKGRRPWRDIEPIWFNKALNTDAAMTLINEGYKPVSYHFVYKKLKARGVTPGRRPKQK